MPAVLKYSIIKESFFHCGCRFSVNYYRDKWLPLMNVHVCNIQEGEIQPDRLGRFFEKRFPEHPIYSL